MSGPGGIIDDHNRSATNLSNLSGVSSSRGSPSSPVSVPAADSAPQSMTLSPLVPATNSTPAMFLDTPNRGSNDTSEERHDDAKKGQKLVIRLSDVEASARVNAGESSLALNNRKDSPISPPTSASPPLTMGESHSSSAPPKSFSQSRLRPGPHQHTAVTALRTPQSMPPSPLARASSYGSQLSNAVNAVGREMVRLVLNRKDGSGRDGSESPSGRKSNSPDGSPLIQGLPVLTPPPRVDTDEDLLSRQVLWEIDRTEIDMRGSKELGTGGYGMVVLARWRGTPVAIKMVNVPSGNQGGNAGGGGHPGNAQIRSSAAFSELRHEIAVMSHMHHPRIVQFLGACTRAQPWMLIFEYMPGGALSTILENAASKGQRVPPKQAARWTLGIAQGLRYLHEHKPRPVVHRDLKPGNVLIDHADNAKISDFGLAKMVDLVKSKDPSHYTMTGETGSYRFMAPEVFRHEAYSEKVDIYSLGCIIFYLFNGEPPFAWLPPLEACRQAAIEHKRPTNRSTLEPALVELCSACWDPRPDSRPSAMQIIEKLEKIFPDIYDADEPGCTCSLS